jgi:hypothetical protein
MCVCVFGHIYRDDETADYDERPRIVIVEEKLASCCCK